MIKFLLSLFIISLMSVLIFQWRQWPPTLTRAGLNETIPGVLNNSTTEAANSLRKLKDLTEQSDYASVTARPLFRPDRRPEPPSSEIDNKINSDIDLDLKSLSLTAILITPTITTAWLKDPKQPKLRKLHLGEELAGWSVQEILPDRVALERKGEKSILLLRDYSKSPPIPSPAAKRPAKPPQQPPKAMKPPTKAPPPKNAPNAPPARSHPPTR